MQGGKALTAPENRAGSAVRDTKSNGAIYGREPGLQGFWAASVVDRPVLPPLRSAPPSPSALGQIQDRPSNLQLNFRCQRICRRRIVCFSGIIIRQRTRSISWYVPETHEQTKVSPATSPSPTCRERSRCRAGGLIPLRIRANCAYTAPAPDPRWR